MKLKTNLKQLFCKHKWVWVYTYNLTADFKCRKCGKRKKDYTSFNLKTYLLIGIFFITSCNPQMHIIGAGMRYHNLSQNKYQPGPKRKQIKLGDSPNSPFWILIRNL